MRASGLCVRTSCLLTDKRHSSINTVFQDRRESVSPAAEDLQLFPMLPPRPASGRIMLLYQPLRDGT